MKKWKFRISFHVAWCRRKGERRKRERGKERGKGNRERGMGKGHKEEATTTKRLQQRPLIFDHHI